MKYDTDKAQFDIIFRALRTLGFKRRRANKILVKLINEFFDTGATS